MFKNTYFWTFWKQCHTQVRPPEIKRGRSWPHPKKVKSGEKEKMSGHI